MKRHQKAGFLSPRSSKIIVTKEEERRKRKRKSEDEERRRRKKAMIALLVFRIASLYFKLLDAKGPFGDNVIKNPARHI